MATVGIALFGVGRWGVHLLRNFLSHPQARVVAVVDPHRDRLTALSARFALDADVLLTAEVSAAMQHPAVQAVVIATPASTHADLTQAALQHRHHVLVEKPLTLDPAGAIALCRLADQQQRQLVVDHTYLFHPAVQQGKLQIQQGQLGSLRYGYAARTHLAPIRQDVDVLWDLAIHDLAILNHWLGELPCQVQTQGTVWLQPAAIAPPQPVAGLADLVWVRLTYPSGFTATLHLCWCNPDKQRRLCVVGSRGALVFDELQAAPLIRYSSELLWQGDRFSPQFDRPLAIEVAPTEPLWQVCDHFLSCVQRNQPSAISSGWMGAQLVSLLTAMTSSLRQGGAPVAIEPGCQLN